MVKQFIQQLIMKTLLKAIKMLEAENKDLEYQLQRAEQLLKVTMEQNTMLRNDLKLLSDKHLKKNK